MTVWLDEEEQLTWRSVLRMHAQLIGALGQALKADSDMSIADYEVLAILSEAPEGALRARDLRGELQWEKSRLAHHIRRMEQRGLLRREACTEDSRAPLVRVTEAGLAAIRAAAPAQVARVRELFFDALTPTQARAMGDAARAVLANVAQHSEAQHSAEEHSAEQQVAQQQPGRAAEGRAAEGRAAEGRGRVTFSA